MNRFRFRLETLLRLRRRTEDEIKLEMAARNREIGESGRRMMRLHDELTGMQERERQMRPHAHDVTALRYSVAYRHSLKLSMLNEGRTTDRLRREAHDIRQRLIEATRKRRAVELLRERRFEQWRKEYSDREQKYIDEVSRQAWSRRKDDTQVESSGTVS